MDCMTRSSGTCFAQFGKSPQLCTLASKKFGIGVIRPCYCLCHASASACKAELLIMTRFMCRGHRYCGDFNQHRKRYSY
jgi:hypothetical protein